MHPLQPLANITRQLLEAMKVRNYPGTALNVAKLLPAVAIMWATDPPRCPDSRARWDTHAAPVLVNLAACREAFKAWGGSTGRRGVYVGLGWIDDILAHAQDVLRLPGLDDLFSAVPATPPDDRGSTPAAVAGR